MKKYKNALVLGKFFPSHIGHLHLINTAIENSEIVHVMVCHNNTQCIPGDIRFNSLKETYENNSNVIVYSCDDIGLPQHENECKTLDEFYGYWVPFVYKYIDKLDVIFTSENYGDDFARYLGINHFLVDKNRIKYNISGTSIRKYPFKNWDFIIESMKPFFVKRIVLMGPESVGKSVLTEKLSNYYNTSAPLQPVAIPVSRTTGRCHVKKSGVCIHMPKTNAFVKRVNANTKKYSFISPPS